MGQWVAARGREADLRRAGAALLNGQHFENPVGLPVEVDDWACWAKGLLPAADGDSGRRSRGHLLERVAIGPHPLPTTKAM